LINGGFCHIRPLIEALQEDELPHATGALYLRNRLDLFFGLGVQIIVTMFLIRLIVLAGLRMVYPFIPQISTGLGLTAIAFSWLIFIRSITGVAGPIFGILSDRYGRRRIMAAGLLFQGVGLASLALSRQWWSIAPMLLLGIGVTAFLPVQFAYISDLVAYNRRGRAMAAVDMSFAVTGIVLLPIVGWLIDVLGWRSPFLILSVFCLLAAAVIWFRFPTAEHRSDTTPPWSATLGVVLRPNVLASIVVSVLLLFAASSSMTIWGIWFSADFGLSAAALGLVATGIGLAELSGIVFAGLFIDRIGKHLGSQIGLLLTAFIFMLLPLTQASLILAVLMLILLGGVLEFSTISLFSLYSEQAPEARAMVFSLTGLGLAVGMALGPPVTIVLWEQVSLWAVCAVSAGCLGLAFVLVWRALVEKSGPHLEIKRGLI
jgi:predicted MFS family arabinose efflux permease